MTWTPPVWITLLGLRRYAVSDRGVVRNGQRELEAQLNDEGYPKVKLVGDDGVRRGYFVHVLVARAFLPPPAIGQTMVLHRNGCRTQCNALNLRWGTHQDNHEDKVQHGTAARGAVRKLSLRDVRRIRRMKLGTAVIAQREGISISHAREIRNGRKWAS